MTLYGLGDIVPKIDMEAFVHPDATIIGNVVLGPRVTVWPQAVLRGDQSRIVVGDVLHVFGHHGVVHRGQATFPFRYGALRPG